MGCSIADAAAIQWARVSPQRVSRAALRSHGYRDQGNMQAIQDFYVASNAVVRGDVVCAAGVNIWFNCVLRADLARITLGPRVNLQDGCIVHTDTGADQEIEEGVVV